MGWDGMGWDGMREMGRDGISYDRPVWTRTRTGNDMAA